MPSVGKKKLKKKKHTCLILRYFFVCEGCKRTREKSYLQWISTKETVKINKTCFLFFFFESIKKYLKINLFYIFISVSLTKHVYYPFYIYFICLETLTKSNYTC